MIASLKLVERKKISLVLKYGYIWLKIKVVKILPCPSVVNSFVTAVSFIILISSIEIAAKRVPYFAFGQLEGVSFLTGRL